MTTTAVILIPGFFGFGTFGRAKNEDGLPKKEVLKPSSSPRQLQYFARVADVLKDKLGAEDKGFVYVGHEPSPTGALSTRARELHDQIKKQIDENGVDRVVLIGHSTGGVDARLVANRAYELVAVSADERARVRDRIAAVISVSAPFHGAPVAQRFRGKSGEYVIQLLTLLSVLTSMGNLRFTGRIALLATAILRRVGGSLSEPEDLVVPTFLAGIDSETALQVQNFLAKIVKDHGALIDLSPANAAARGEHLQASDHPIIKSFVTVAPKPGGYLSSLFSGDAPILRMLYRYAYEQATPRPAPSLARFPNGPWIGGDTRVHDSIAKEIGINDGVVPAASQTIDGSDASGIVLGDHLDVVGHYDDTGGGGTFFKSGADFKDERFLEFWTTVATAIATTIISSSP